MPDYPRLELEFKSDDVERIRHKAQAKVILAPSLGRFFVKVGAALERSAKIRTKVDTGRTRAATRFEVDKATVPAWGRLFNDMPNALWMEYGTGTQSDSPNKSGRRHWPPGAALDLWARRHGFASGFVVAKIIGMRGGLRPVRMFRGARDENQGRFGAWIVDLGREINDAWSKR